MRRIGSVGLAGGLALGALLAGGCSTVALDKEGEMAATYVAGEFRMLVNANAGAAASATAAAFKQLGLFQIKNEVETYRATLAARTAKDEKVNVVIAEVNSRQTMLRIRVDIVGDRNFSRKLYEQIERNLANRGGAGVGAGVGVGVGAGSTGGGVWTGN